MASRSWLATVLSASLLACGGESESAGGTGGGTQVEPLCDGSDSIRLLLWSAGGGPLEQTFEFTNPFGHKYLIVTGKCLATLSSDYMDGVREATLSQAQAESLASDVRRSKIAPWSGYEEKIGCPDAGRVSISDGTNVAWCTCGCDPDAPSGLEGAIDKAHEWYDELWALGSPSTGPIAAAALLDEDPYPGASPLLWPLAWAPSTLPSPILDPKGKVVEGADAAKLRQLREDASQPALPSQYIPAVTSSQERFRVYARDELPAALAAAFLTLTSGE